MKDVGHPFDENTFYLILKETFGYAEERLQNLMTHTWSMKEPFRGSYFASIVKNVKSFWSPYRSYIFLDQIVALKQKSKYILHSNIIPIS